MQLVLGFDGDGDDAAAHLHEDLRISKFLAILFCQLWCEGIKILFAKPADYKGSGDDVVVLKFSVKREADELAFLMTNNGNRVIIGIDGFDVAADNLLQGVQVTGDTGYTRRFFRFNNQYVHRFLLLFYF